MWRKIAIALAAITVVAAPVLAIEGFAGVDLVDLSDDGSAQDDGQARHAC